MSHPPTPSPTDQQLVKRILRGEQAAFTELVKRTEGLVAQLVFKMIRQPADRQDLTQDVYLKVFKSLPGFKFQAKLVTWVGHIAYNTCCHYLEKKQLVLIDLGSEERGNDAAHRLPRVATPVATETESMLFSQELLTILNAELEKLPPLYRTLLALYHQEELSYGEIAQITALPEGTVKSYLFRARKRLKENLLVNYQRDELCPRPTFRTSRSSNWPLPKPLRRPLRWPTCTPAPAARLRWPVTAACSRS
ncbi:MAG: RNA polymerase sigma factor [Janthinobacterium lividum]